MREASINHLQRVMRANKTLTPLNTSTSLVLSDLCIACVLVLRPVYPELVMFSDFELRTTFGISIFC